MVARAPAFAGIDVCLTVSLTAFLNYIGGIAVLTIDPPVATQRVSADGSLGREVSGLIFAIYGSVLCLNAFAVLHMVLDDTGLLVVLVTEGNPVVGGICTRKLDAVAQTASALEVCRFEHQGRQSIVIGPFVDTEFISGSCKVAGNDMSVEHLDIAESQSTAVHNRTLVEVAEVFTGLCINNLDVAVVVYAVELAVVVAEVTDLGSIIALGVFCAFLFGEVPAFIELQRRSLNFGGDDDFLTSNAGGCHSYQELIIVGRTAFAVSTNLIGIIKCYSYCTTGLAQRSDIG